MRGGYFGITVVCDPPYFIECSVSVFRSKVGKKHQVTKVLVMASGRKAPKSKKKAAQRTEPNNL